MIQIAVCDDDISCINEAVEMIETWSKDSSIPVEIHSFDNGDELIKKNDHIHMDIIFLDIVMPLLNGIDTAKELRQKDKTVKIIFLTSSPEYALKSYSVKAHDYLLKPITYMKIKEVLDECSSPFNQEAENIVIKTTIGYQKLYFHDIEYLEAQNRKVFFYMQNGKLVETNEPFYSFEKKFMGNVDFFKCHRSYIIYIPNVDHFDNRSITTKFGRSVPIARGFGKAFQDAYFAIVFNE